LVAMKAYTTAGDGSNKVVEGPVPPSMEAAANSAREALVEMVAEADEQLMEKFFDAGTLSQEDLLAGLEAAMIAGTLVPLVCTSGLQNIGAAPLLDVLVDYVPSPAVRPFEAVVNGETVTRTADENAPYAALVWKTVADQFAGR